MTSIENFTAKENETVRLYAMITRAGGNALEDYREGVWQNMTLGAADADAHSASVASIAAKYRIR